MNTHSRTLVYVALFGALLGLIEMSLGTVLKEFRLPLGGLFMSSLAVILFIVGRTLAPGRGVVLGIGLLAAFLKLITAGPVFISPVLAILFEAALIELLLTLFTFSKTAIYLSATLTAAYIMCHPLLVQGLLFGENTVQLYIDLFHRLSGSLGLNNTLLWPVMALYILLHLATGFLTGVIAYRISRRIARAEKRSKPVLS